MVSSLPTQSEQPKRRSNDPISWYLQNIGRVPLLTPAEEIELGNQVQKMMILTEDGQLNEKINDFTTQQKRTIKIGRRAKERMMKANLRLVVSVAKKSVDIFLHKVKSIAEHPATKPDKRSPNPARAV